MLAQLKELDPKYKELTVRVNRRRSGGRAAQRDAAGTAAAPVAAADAGLDENSGSDYDTGAPAGLDPGADEADGQDDGVAVSASGVRDRAPQSPPRPVTRQQRVTGSGQRRAGTTKKKRR